MGMALGPAYGDGFAAIDNFSLLPTLYIRGDSITEGSVRLVIEPPKGNRPDVIQVQRRLEGVWNPTELQLSQSSLLLGEEVSLAAIGHHLMVQTPGVIVPEKHLYVSQDFDDTGTGEPESTILSPLVTRFVSQPDNSLELTLTDHAVVAVSFGQFIISGFYIQTGTVGASADVEILLTQGVSPNEVVFFSQNFPASSFTANTEVRISLEPGSQFESGTQLNTLIRSDNAFTLKYNAAGTNLFNANDFQQLEHEQILTETLVLSNDLSTTYSNDLTLARPNKVFQF